MKTSDDRKEIDHRIQRLLKNESVVSKPKRMLQPYLLGLVLIVAIGSFAFSNFENPTVSIALDKMNKLYLGLENPITVAVAGIPNEQLKVESDYLLLKDLGNGHFNAIASKPGLAKIKVTAKGHATKELDFRVRRIPDPLAKIAGKTGGKITAKAFKESEGVDAILERFEYDAACDVKRYTFTYVAKGGEPKESKNIGGKHNELTKSLINQAKSSDIYYIDQVVCQCPGDRASRPINSMVFKIE